jgi:hypothetical protein
MGTCCRENVCTDEYDGVARSLDSLLCEGMPLQAALMNVLVDYFGEALIEGSDIAPARMALQERMTKA